jgi:hypothetical protein
MPRSKPCLGLNPENALNAGPNLSHTVVRSAVAASADSINLGRQARDRFHARIAVHA